VAVGDRIALEKSNADSEMVEDRFDFFTEGEMG
jgi:hypothetical protein